MVRPIRPPPSLAVRLALAAPLALALAAPCSLAQDLSDVRIRTVDVAPGIHMLVGSGGNIGVSTGADGAFVIDDQFAPLHDRIRGAIEALDGGPLRFVLNTHWHGDHTGGNEAMSSAGAVIVAHEQVRARMSRDQYNPLFDRTTKASSPAALPVVTFGDGLTFHWNGHEIRVFHVGPAHTDGDSVVHFVDAGVFHVGDTFFNGSYPFVDLASGGRIDGLLAAVDRVLALAGPDAKIIPGHGPLADRKDLVRFREVVGTVRDRIRAAIDAGRSLEEVLAAGLTDEFDGAWGQGFMKPEVFTGIVYRSLAGRAGEAEAGR